jgi:hypothetical protein
MKKAHGYLSRLGILSSLLLLSSCATRSTEDQWKNDDARYKEQLKRYPDRESAEQQKSEAAAARKADSLRK